jgi:hypothetical protein
VRWISKIFLRETLLQIQRGIGEAQTELHGKYRGVIAPLFKPIESMTDADMEWVEFDVAITVTEGAEKDVGGKLNIAAISLGASGKKVS